MKTLAFSMKEYLRVRRSLGYKLRDTDGLLRHFVSFAKKHHASYITTKLALQWSSQPLDCQPARKTARLTVVRRFAHYLSAFDPRTETPPKGLLRHRSRRIQPYLYREEDIVKLIEAANKLPSPRGLRGATLATLFGLLAVTGMRIGEAVGLDRTDVDLRQDLITVRKAKGNKSRYVPIHASTRAVLKRYERRRSRIQPGPQSPRFFLSERGTGLTEGMVRFWFVRISRQIGLRGITDSHGPRIHDLRHRFAIRTLLNWYRTDRDVEVHLPELTTFLGHGRVIDTYWYLTATPALLQLATRRWQREGGGPLS
jgi:integrase